MSHENDYTLALSNCENEPIRTPGAIQSFGCLIAADLDFETITHASENLAHYCQVEATDILDQPLAHFFSREQIHAIRNALGSLMGHHQRQRLQPFEFNGKFFEVSVHKQDKAIIIELEPILEDRRSPPSIENRIQSMMGYLQGSMDSDALLKKAVVVLRHVTGFDRVMAYRFLPDGAGEVVQEACSSTLESFLGLRYPATDIPRQVRELVSTMPVRIIANVTDTDQPKIVTHGAQSPLDLSLAYLRGFSPIHQEYLTNMGVTASMTIAIIVQGELWGLFACHQYSPRLLSASFRTVCELFSQLFSLKLQQTLAEERLHYQRRTDSVTRHLLEPPQEDFDFSRSAQWLGKTLCALFDADGLAVIAERQIDRYGSTLPPDLIMHLIHQCHAHTATDVIPIERLQQISWPPNSDLGQIAGALVLCISEVEELYVIFFRNEIAQTVRWAGTPEKEVVYGDFGPRLRPRASFEEYIESVSGQCTPWTLREIETALSLRMSLLELAVRRVDLIQQEAVRRQQQQDLLIAELNHRVKNILALIRSISRQTKNSATTLPEFVSNLEQRIVALASAHDLVSGVGLDWPSLRELLIIEFKPYFADAQVRVDLHGADVRLKANFIPTFALVFHELVANSVKYGALSTSSGTIEVSWTQEDGGLAIYWRERNGPPVFPPERRGFGLNLIERSIPYEFEGISRIRFLPQGVEADFWVPGKLVLWQSSSKTSTASHSLTPTRSSTEPPTGKVLILEDNMLIAMDLEAMAQSLGFSGVASVPRVSEALTLLQRDNFAVGLLDINLQGETSLEVADAMLKQGIPFLFTTGYDSSYEMPAHLTSIPRITKPIDIEKLTQALNQLLE